jgi:hypothetical protein
MQAATHMYAPTHKAQAKNNSYIKNIIVCARFVLVFVFLPSTSDYDLQGNAESIFGAGVHFC